MKKIAYDHMQIDSLKIVQDTNRWFKVSAVISKVGVYQYEDGYALKSRRELLKATRTARNAKLTIGNHPPTKVVMSQNQLFGQVEEPYFDRDKMRATLSFDRAFTSPNFIEKMRTAIQNGQGLDDSIGFYYEPDYTPGFDIDVNTGQKRRYDYVMRDIVIDHVVVVDQPGVQGRCTFPNCGVGVDTMMQRIALDPFADYENFADCVAKNKDKADPEAYCATIKRSVEGNQMLGGKKKEMSSETGEVIENTAEEFNKCVSQRMADGYTKEQADVYCQAYTTPESQPTPPMTDSRMPKIPEKLDADYPWDQCISDQTGQGYSEEQAKRICAAIKNRTVSHASKFAKTKDLAEAAKLVIKKAETDKLFAYNLDNSVAQFEAEDQAEVEQTEMERCVANKVDDGMSEEEAASWCKAELAGEHQATDTLIDRSSKLIKMREQSVIEKNREARRHPL
jgi:hypothetical protein